MEDQCAAVNWPQYHVRSASYVPWYHYAPPASFFQPHQVHRSLNYVAPQGGYGVFQPHLWDYHTGAWPDTSGQASKQAASAVCNKMERSASETRLLGECHDPLPMDISPSASPTLSISTKSPTKCADSELKSDLLCSSPTKPSVLTTMQFSPIKITETSAPVLSLLAKCNACMKKMLAQARGTKVPVNEPCTCSIKQEKAADWQNKSGSSAMYEPPKVRTFEDDSLMKHKPKAITINDMAEEPRKRVVVQRVNGVARLITFPDKFPVPHNVQNAQARNTEQGRLFTTHEGQHGPSSAELNFPEHCLKQKSSSSKDPRKASPKVERDCAKKFVGPSRTASECAKSSSTCAQGVSAQKNRSARRKRQRMRKREKYLRLLNAVPSRNTEQSVAANKVCSLKQPAHSVSTDAELSTSTTSVQRSQSSQVSHSAEESANNSLETLSTTVHIPANQCSIDISSRRMSEDKPVKLEREDCRTGSICSGDICSSTCTGELSTDDVVVGGNVMGIYHAPEAEVDRGLITSIEMCVDLKLGGYTEHLDRPVSFVSQLEKLDEGWVWCFN